MQAHLDFNTLIERLTSPGSAELQTAVASSFLGISALTWGLVLGVYWRCRKERHVPFAYLVARCNGRPYTCFSIDTCCNDGCCRCFFSCKIISCICYVAACALNLVAYVGAISALFAAVIACTQTDIKRVLAYSTMSQIGYMMFALGVSGYGGENGLGYTASMFHLFTHALFKSLLFLGAGAVIHFIHSNEMKDMGGLRKYLPVTHITFLIACLAIAGIPPFAGSSVKKKFYWQHISIIQLFIGWH